MPLASLQVTGIAEASAAASRISREAAAAWRSEIRRTVAPFVGDIKARYRRLGGAKAGAVARSVRAVSSRKGVGLQVGRRSMPWVRPKEFGAKRNRTRRFTVRHVFGKSVPPFEVVRAIPYNSPRIFGPYRPSGKAFYPSVGDARQELTEALTELVSRWARIISGA